MLKKFFFFYQDKNVVYIAKLTAHLSPFPVCQGCASKRQVKTIHYGRFKMCAEVTNVSVLFLIFILSDKTYFGLLDHSKLFIAAHGGTFKCKSENVLLMSSEMKLRLVPLQIQAFTLPTGPHGNGESE